MRDDRVKHFFTDTIIAAVFIRYQDASSRIDKPCEEFCDPFSRQVAGICDASNNLAATFYGTDDWHFLGPTPALIWLVIVTPIAFARLPTNISFVCLDNAVVMSPLVWNWPDDAESPSPLEDALMPFIVSFELPLSLKVTDIVSLASRFTPWKPASLAS